MRPGQLHVAIIGAGATGTELSAELHRTARQVVAYGLDRIDPDKDIRITLIEAAPRILPAPARAHLRGHREAPRRASASRCWRTPGSARSSADGVALADGRFVPAELVVWSAGVRGPDVLAHLDGLEVGRANQLVVLPTLQTTRDPDIFAIGDCAECPRDGPPRPGAAARPGRPPAGEPHGAADPPPPARRAARSPSSTATSARWSASATTRPSAT